MSTLPFKLKSYHKPNTKGKWKIKGLIMDDFESIYQEYIYQTNCEICGKLFETSTERHMEHNHTTGEFRNIVCQRCNNWKADYKRKNDVSPYIRKENHKKYKQGFRYIFRVFRDGKYVISKSSINLEFLKSFRDKWINENPHWFT